ncbi:MAG TPA: DUF1573 domain-containing protein [Patescibacteria group bacterium]|nr:DUF1573 domain-containing protein [Patescibacteria group bacterium]
MNENKIFIIIGATTILLLTGVVFLAGRTSNAAKVEVNEAAKVATKSKSYDWGQIGINNGKVEAIFDIENQGQVPLKLFNVTTSCACTTAQIITEKEASPLFGMHTKSDFVGEVAPGKKAILKVVYDPLFHGPNGLGSISREITVTTNDASNPKLVFNTTADVVK